jgi:hypothetical protein
MPPGRRGPQSVSAIGRYFFAKYRFLSANEQNGNYVASGFFEMSAAMGAGALAIIVGCL